MVAEALKLLGYTEVSYAEREKKEVDPFTFPYAGFEGDTDFPWSTFGTFALGIGDNNIRTKLLKLVTQQGKKVLSVVHPAASVSTYATLEEGTFIARGACVNPLVQIGKAVIVNTSASIDHECRISDGAHIAPGAVLAGNVQIGTQCFIGANAMIREGVKVGDRTVVGAGAVVLKDLPSDITVFGNPARVIGRRTAPE